MARYQVRFTRQVLRDVRKAVTRYNSMLGRYVKSGGKTIAKPVTVDEIRNTVKNTAEMREYIKRLNDYRKVSDFATEKAKGYRFTTTRGERRTLKRLDTAARRRYNKEIERLNKMKSTASAEELINDILPKVAELEAKPVVVSNIKNRGIFEKVLRRYERERLQRDLLHPAITLDHYLAAFTAMGLETAPGGAQLFQQLAGMSEKEFAQFISTNDDIGIDYIYDVGIDAAAKVNEISARLGNDITELL